MIMNSEDSKKHWDQVYETKPATEVSWYEPMPEISLNYITECKLQDDAAIIDIGAGDSYLIEFLVAKGFTDLTVLDISEKALERAKKRLAEKAELVNWKVQDVTQFSPEKQYDLWHDRGTFHFLTETERRGKYLETVKKAIKPGGFLILATFSENGPDKCSGLEVAKYSVGDLQQLFSEDFITMSCRNVDHETPSGTKQNFTFCCFRKKE